MARATQPTLPYYAPEDLLPAPLPTAAEILASTKRVSRLFESAVVRVGDHYAVKFGGMTTLQEGENMLFVQQSTDIPIPRVYAVFHDKESELDFIVMEYIPGGDLEVRWPTFNTDEKRAIISQLRQQMDELRRIPSPGYYGGVWGKPMRSFHFRHPNDPRRPHAEPEISGPHKTEEQFVEAMCLALGKMAVEAPERHTAMFRRNFRAVFRGHEPVFTHANLLLRNIMLRPNGAPVIIDWEQSGWYPSFWEYCCAIVILLHEDDWNEWIYDILDEYPAELGWMAHHHDTMKMYN
jgi:serine/threonine protein kinase